GYFQPFEFNVTSALLLQGNVLLVRVNSPFEKPDQVWPDKKRLIKGIFGHHDCRPGSWHAQHGQAGNTGGIWNDVELVATDRFRITRIKASPKLMPDGSAIVAVQVAVDNLSVDDVQATVTVEIEAADGTNYEHQWGEQLSEGGNVIFSSQRIESPRLWWTWEHGEPHLYNLRVSVESGSSVARAATRFGLREVRIDANGNWSLNGQQFFVRGTNIIPTQWLSEYDAAMVQRDIALLKEANVNAVRVHAHVNRQEFYSACDEAGLLVWQDFALQWGYSPDREFTDQATKQVKEMVNLLYNHPCIALWCCHNEPGPESEQLDQLLHDAVLEEDPFRAVHPSSDFAEHPYYGWYYGCYEQFVSLPGRPLPTEFGAQALPCLETMRLIFDATDLWPPNWDRWAFHDFQYDQTFHVAHISQGDDIGEFITNSQQYQYDLLKYIIETYRRARYAPISGVFQFMFVDCWPAITWSVVDYHRRPKLGYEALRLAYQPLLVSLDVRRRELVAGARIFTGLYIVNDLGRSFAGAKVELIFEDSAGHPLARQDFVIDVSPHSVQLVADTNLHTKDWRVPLDASPGNYKLRAKIMSAHGDSLSENWETIVVRKTFAREYGH
ncbi:MAG: glycoside hydrolase family 2 TIM barrel-domain containing protein, partial [Chloroflexota bacterium]|nr:glycoside hydrolase family 2 TIM barrel-domain containing protein [Chloroflexota bacterium]